MSSQSLQCNVCTKSLFENKKAKAITQEDKIMREI